MTIQSRNDCHGSTRWYTLFEGAKKNSPRRVSALRVQARGSRPLTSEGVILSCGKGDSFGLHTVWRERARHEVADVNRFDRRQGRQKAGQVTLVDLQRIFRLGIRAIMADQERGDEFAAGSRPPLDDGHGVGAIDVNILVGDGLDCASDAYTDYAELREALLALPDGGRDLLDDRPQNFGREAVKHAGAVAGSVAS